uniref:Uncharacterized protein n=1 Tax=Arundo donax TaxID=35708 RepID=A0A0A9DHI6_ARUDO
MVSATYFKSCCYNDHIKRLITLDLLTGRLSFHKHSIAEGREQEKSRTPGG